MLNLLNEAKDSKFVTRKRNIVNDNSKPNYDTTNEMTYNTEILKSNICDYNDAYILVRGDVIIIAAPATQIACKSFKYKAKLLGNAAAMDDNAANGIIRNATIAVSLKEITFNAID